MVEFSKHSGKSPEDAIIISDHASHDEVNLEISRFLVSKFGDEEDFWQLEVHTINDSDGNKFNVVKLSFQGGRSDIIYFRLLK